MRTILLLIASGLIIGCSQNPVSAPPDISVSQLLSSPDTITLDGTQLYLTSYLNRDFMPMSPPDGQPLFAQCIITSTDTLDITKSISADAVWIVYQSQVWKSWLSSPTNPPDTKWRNCVAKVALNGPKWGPHVNVDVIVRVIDSKRRTQLLRASDQWIGRTE